MPLLNPSAPQPAQAGQLPELPPGPSLDSIRGPVEIPLFEAWQVICISLLATALLTILISWIVRYMLKRSKRPPEQAAHQMAKHAIQQTAGDEREFTQQLTQALRRYLNSTLKRPILAQTSEEILQHLPPNFPIAADQLKAFFQRCDTIKFAQASLTEEQRNELADTALQFIQTVHQSKQEASDK